jgi:tetraacyldisaccharide 4'-kinase
VRTTTRGLSHRLATGWDVGFGGATGATLGAMAAAYRGLLETRGWLYERGLLRARSLACPVVSIGNLTVGGTSKTPAVELAVKTLADLGHRSAIVSRGYGRTTRGVQVVTDGVVVRLDAEQAGDEPFLLSRRLPGVPIVVGADRWEAAELARSTCGATAIVLDDGLQQRTLTTSLNVVMARASRPWGNGRLLPAGPLREPLTALARADLVVTSGVGDVSADEVRDGVARFAPGVPVVTATLEPVACWDARSMEPLPLERLAGLRAVPFAGIASPASFAATLSALKISGDVIAFPDHHWYSADDLRALTARGASADALVTTEKDWVRLRGRLHMAAPLYVVCVALRLLTGEDAWRHAFERCPSV